MSKNAIDTSVLDGIIVGRVEPHIYAFTTETIPNYLKVGDTYRSVEVRLDEWRKHFPKLKHTFDHIAKTDDNRIFRDYSVHQFLENEKHRKRLTKNKFPKQYYSNEFFENATKKDVSDAISDICADAKNNSGKYLFYDETRLPEIHTYERTECYEPRPNQDEAIKNFKKAYKAGRNKLLMYAVMRFGKSFTSLCCATEMNAKLVVVVSAKADVKEEWKKTTESHIRFKDYIFADSNSLKANKKFITETLKSRKRIVLFLTLQDLQGDEIKGKHSELFKTKIDLLLVDESHFGARASEYGRVLQDFNVSKQQLKRELQKEVTLDQLDENLKILNADVTMHLSGTPYRILMSDEFTEDDIVAFYQFSDIDDDKKKWDNEHLNDDSTKEWDNPYYGFPQMVRFAFNPSESVRKRLEKLKDEGCAYAFSKLFRPLSIEKDEKKKLHKQFQYPNEVLDLLSVIDGSKNDDNVLGFLDYDKIKSGEMCHHIVMVLPFRASCDALEKMLTDNKRKFRNLSNYQIINIAGVDNDKAYKDTKDVKRKISECEQKGQKTITLTVNRMLTGSTVEQWDTMIYLKDTASPQEYDQAIFRIQNQFIKTYIDNKGDLVKFNMKPQTLLVDFDIDRVFRMQEQKSQIYNVNTCKNGNSLLKNRIQKELEISPIIVVNKDKLQKVEPTAIMDAVREYSRSKSVADEANDIPTDFSLLDNKKLRAAIEKLTPIDAKNGLEIKPKDGDDDFDIPSTTGKKGKSGDSGGASVSSSDNYDEQKVLAKKLATYYSQILFYAFLTESKVESLTDIIADVDKNDENKRICRNVGLSKSILQATQEFSNHFVLSKLDYKIQNINTLIRDKDLEPINRVETAMRKFGRLGTAEIVTPADVADKIVALLPKDYKTRKVKILDIASKQGEFTTALYRRYGDNVKKSIYTLPTSPITYEFTLKVYKLLGMPTKNVIANFTSFDLINENNDKYIKQLLNMKFDAIVGNPPYHEVDGSGASSDAGMPLYNKFIDVLRNIKPHIISLIIPSKWMTGGRNLHKFREDFMNDRHLDILIDYEDSSECFANQHIDGGICYFRWNSDYNGKVDYSYKDVNGHTKREKRYLNDNNSSIVIRDTRRLSLIDKVSKEKKFNKIVSSTRPFGIRKDLFNKPGNYSDFKTSDSAFKNSVLIWGVKGIKGGAKRTSCYIDKKIISRNANWADKHKLFFTTSYSTNATIPPEPILAKPNVICTETFLVIGPFETAEEMNNCNKYIRTRFFRLYLYFGKGTMQVSKEVFQFVPLQDFTLKSDIDWSKSVAEIDKQLYKKYGLSGEEQAFIEGMIKEME